MLELFAKRSEFILAFFHLHPCPDPDIQAGSVYSQTGGLRVPHRTGSAPGSASVGLYDDRQ